MAVAHVASSQSHASASFSVSQASFSWTHTTTTDPQGAVVLVFQGVASADAVTSVTYAGTTMTHVGSARASDTATEPGSVDVYFLGSGIPAADNPTVQVNRTNNTTSMWAVCATQTAATDTEIAGIVLVSNDGAIAQQSVDDGSTGVDSVRYSGVYYGGATPAPAGANSTLLGTTNDAGAYGWTAVRETTAGQGSRLVGCTQATSDDRAIVAFAVREVYVPPGPTITPFETADWTGTGATKTITLTGCVTGDEIVVLYGGDNGTGGSNVSAASVSTTSGSTGTWAEPEEGLGSSNQAWISSSVADVTADGSVTVTLSRTQGTGQPWGGWAGLVHNHNGIGVHARSANSANETVSLAGLTQDSAVLILGIDWDDLANVAFSPAGAVDVERSAGTNVAWYAGYWLAQASGTRSYGIATSSTANFVIIAIEALAATAGGISGTIAVTQAANAPTASGQLGYSGTSAASQAANTASATGTVSGPVTGTAAPVQANQTASASGQLGYSGTVAATQAAQTSTAAGQLGYSGTVAASQAAQTASASGTYTAGGSFSGTVAVTQANQTASATGQLGYSGTASPVQANQTASATGKLGYSGTIAVTQAANTSAATGLVVIPITGTVAALQANQTAVITGQFAGLVTFGTASAGAGTRPTAQGATASTPTASAAAAGVASASSRTVTVPTATGG